MCPLQARQALSAQAGDVQELQDTVQKLALALNNAEKLAGDLEGQAAAEREGREDATAALVAVQSAIQKVNGGIGDLFSSTCYVSIGCTQLACLNSSCDKLWLKL